MFSTRIRTLVRQQWAGLIALFLVLTGGTALATHPGGQNTISTGDIQNGQVKTDDIGNGEVKVADIGQGAVGSDEIKNAAITNEDIAVNSIGAGRILDATLTGADVAANSLKGADVDESTLDIGDTARAYARVTPSFCTGTPGTCTPQQSKGVSSVTRDFTGRYCVTAPGIDSAEVPAAVTVDAFATNSPEGNASAMTLEGVGCGPTGDGFLVVTERQPQITVDANGGTNNATASGPAVGANDVGFTIVIP